MHPVELHPLQIPEPGGLSATISGVPIETFLAPSGTGGGRRRAGLRGVAALLSGMGIETVGLVVAGEEEVQPEAGVFACPLPTLGGTMEWVGHQEHQNALVDVAGLFADRAPEPTDGPKLWTLGRVIIVDLCIGHRRPGFCILMGPAAALRPVPVPDLPLRSFLLAVSGMLRADAWRRTIERLVDSLARTSREASGPVTSAQEAAAWAAREAHEILDGVARATGHPQVSVHLPDPDDGLVWDLAVREGRRTARHAGVSEVAPAGLPFDWVAAEAMTPAAGAGQVVVRRIAGRAQLDALLSARGLQAATAAVGEGPWTVAQRPLSRRWSPSRRNLVVVLAGRPVAARWSEPTMSTPLGPDEQGRLSALVERIHDRVMASLDGGLSRWRDTMRASVLAELERRAGPDGVARALAAGLGAGAVTIWRRDGDTLRCVGAAGRAADADIQPFSIPDELLDPREHGLLRTPLFRSARELSEDGFLLWGPMVAALGDVPCNVGTVPLGDGDGSRGLVRVDDVRPVFAGLISGVDAPGLRRWLPDRVPAHTREMLDQVVRWLGLAAPWTAGFARTNGAVDAPSDWKRFVASATSGHLAAEAVEHRLVALARMAPGRGAAAALVGVHRNTFRRHLQAIAERFGPEVVPWDS